MGKRKILSLILFIFTLSGCEKDENGKGTLQLLKIFAGPDEISMTDAVTTGVPVDRSFSLIFSLPVDQPSAASSIILKKDGQKVNTTIAFTSPTALVLFPVGALSSNTTYTIELTDQLKGASGEDFVPTSVNFTTALSTLTVKSVKINDIDQVITNRLTGVPLNLGLTIQFSGPVNEETLHNAISLFGLQPGSLQISLSGNDEVVTLTTSSLLKDLTKYSLTVSNKLKGAHGEPFTAFSVTLYTAEDAHPDFPLVSDEELLTQVQQQTFKYFWNFGHPASGMARERNTSGDIVTSGGSGFGLMSIIVGIERNFITREEGLDRLEKILGFLENADRFHGAWSHWINGNSGDVVPFSINDNGGDLVETSFLIQGLITFRQYLNDASPVESTLINRINSLWEAVEWDWYTRGGQNVLYWHWSPDKEWTMNHPIRGYNECLITYVLAASSSTHPITPAVYHSGWAGGGTMANGKSFYGIPLPLGSDYGGPLFFAHYSFLGLDPRNLTDTYASYWTQNVNHSRINHAHSMANPKKFIGYSDHNWGLTASDNHQGYSAHSPTNDLGVISPTAALSSIPYTPDESMKALKFFYYTLGDRLWGQYGFYDAFNLTEGWTADSYLAIDQGPVIVMIENYRTGLLWNLFMSAPEVQAGLNSLSFTY